jgi:hypothetical protein
MAPHNSSQFSVFLPANTTLEPPTFCSVLDHLLRDENLRISLSQSEKFLPWVGSQISPLFLLLFTALFYWSTFLHGFLRTSTRVIHFLRPYITKQDYILPSFFFVGWGVTQSLVLARQVLYYLSHAHSPLPSFLTDLIRAELS